MLKGSMQRDAVPCNGEKSVILFGKVRLRLAVPLTMERPPVQLIAPVCPVSSHRCLTGRPCIHVRGRVCGSFARKGAALASVCGPRGITSCFGMRAQ